MNEVDFGKAIPLKFGSVDDRLVKAVNENLLKGLNSALETVAGVNIPFILILGTTNQTFHGGNREPYLLRDMLLEYAERIAEQKRASTPL